MTAPRKDTPQCPHCHQPAYSGLLNGQCWLCARPVISAAALAQVTAYEQGRFEALGITR